LQCCGCHGSGSDFGEVLVPALDPESIEQSFRKTNKLTKSCLFNVIFPFLLHYVVMVRQCFVSGSALNLALLDPEIRIRCGDANPVPDSAGVKATNK
jgi:hypothetical protein